MFSDKIFISYRRDEYPNEAQKISDLLRRILPYNNVFFDRTSITSGKDFPIELDRAIQQSTIVIVVIGEKWANLKGLDGQTRISSRGDFVRIEVSKALAEGKTVIPVLCNDAKMPKTDQLPLELKDLSFKHALSAHTEKLELAISVLIKDHKIGIFESSVLHDTLKEYYLITEWEPNISRKKTNVSAYKNLPAYEEIIGIIDFTISGNAKHYMAFSNAGIYHRNIGTNKNYSFRPYASIGQVTFDERHETLFIDNEAWSLVGTMPDKAFELVKKIMELRK